MTRRLVLAPEEAERWQRDTRYQAALGARLAPDASWQTRGSCTGVDPMTFFPEEPAGADVALGLCNRCTVRGHCLAAALTTAEPEGVWGATTPDERRRMRAVWTDRWRA